jgi:hypothetical protein
MQRIIDFSFRADSTSGSDVGVPLLARETNVVDDAGDCLRGFQKGELSGKQCRNPDPTLNTFPASSGTRFRVIWLWFEISGARASGLDPARGSQPGVLLHSIAPAAGDARLRRGPRPAVAPKRAIGSGYLHAACGFAAFDVV